MSEVKTIKGVEDSTWSEFKSMAHEEKKNMGDLFEDMVEYYKKKKAKDFWNDILTVKEPLTDYEADIVRKRAEKMRKDFKFKKVKWD